MKGGWASRPKFQASHGLNMMPEGLVEGNKILDPVQGVDVDIMEEGNFEKVEKYEGGQCSEMKEEVARQLREEYGFETTGNPEWDIGIGLAWRELKDDLESEESVSSSLGRSAGKGRVMRPKSKRQLKRERQRERQQEEQQERQWEKQRENASNLDTPMGEGGAVELESKQQWKRKRQRERRKEKRKEKQREKRKEKRKEKQKEKQEEKQKENASNLERLVEGLMGEGGAMKSKSKQQLRRKRQRERQRERRKERKREKQRENVNNLDRFAGEGGDTKPKLGVEECVPAGGVPTLSFDAEPLNVCSETESAWVQRNRESYEGGRCSELKEEVARQLQEEYGFETTGNPDWDIGIGLAWRELRDDLESEESVSSGLGGSMGEYGVMESESSDEHDVGSSLTQQNGERYEGGRCSVLKEEVARQLREEHGFQTTGNPEWDIGIGLAWRELKDDLESDEDLE